MDYIMLVSVDTITEKGYLLHPRRGSRKPAEYLTDTDFADDIALISQSLEHAQDLLQSLEQASNLMGWVSTSTRQKLNA